MLSAPHRILPFSGNIKQLFSRPQVKRLAKDPDFVFATEQNYDRQTNTQFPFASQKVQPLIHGTKLDKLFDDLTKEHGGGDPKPLPPQSLTTICTRPTVISFSDSTENNCSEFQRLIIPYLDEIRDLLVAIYEALEDIENPRSLNQIVRELMSGITKTQDIEDFFYVVSGEAALEPEIFSSLLPQGYELEGYNPVQLSYLISDQIRKIREDEIKHYFVAGKKTRT